MSSVERDLHKENKPKANAEKTALRVVAVPENLRPLEVCLHTHTARNAEERLRLNACYG